MLDEKNNDIDLNRSVVVVIDMQQDFLSENAPIRSEGGMGIIPNIDELLTLARTIDIPIIFTKEAHRASRVDFGRELDYGETLHCLENTCGVQIIAKLAPQIGDHILVKRRYSAFFATDLDLLLRGLDVNTLILTGVMTDVCVRATAQDAMQFDYYVVVPRECVAGTTHARHEAALENIDYIFGKVSDPDPKSCSTQKQNSGMINTPLNGGCADEKVTIHRRADCLCPEAGRAGYVRAGRLPQTGHL